MTGYELYSFIHDNSIEWHRSDNCGTQDVLIFPYLFHLEKFCNLIKAACEDDEGVSIIIKDGYAAIWMNDICNYFGIEMDEIFVGEQGYC